jgi:hypothetical protein
MDSKQIRGLCEAYVAVYDEELRDDISIEEDLSFIDDLSDNELDQVMEEILSEGVELSECVQVFEGLILEMNPYAPAGSKEAKAYNKSTTKSKRSAEASERRTARMERIKGAAKRAGERAKTLGAGAVSAAAGGAAKVGGKLKSAKEKIVGLVKRVGSAVKAGASAAKKEFSGQSAREAKARTTGREMRRAARRQAAASRGRDTSEFKASPVGTSANPRIGQPGKERPALPAAKTKTVSVDRRKAAAAKLASAASGSGPSETVQQGQPAGTFKTKKSRIQAQKREARLTASESFELLDILVQDLINDGYVNNVYEAYDLIENLCDDQTSNLVESYLIEEVETLDLYDVVLEHLLDEGYADSVESAEAIMVNMSEDWRNNILDSSRG